MTDKATRILAIGVPLELGGQEIRLKYNMLAINAIESRFGDKNPLAAILDREGDTSTGTLCYIVGAGCLHDRSGLDIDVNAIIEGELSTEKAAAKAGLHIMALIDAATETEVVRDALAKAFDLSAPLAICRACQHSFGSHGWFRECDEKGCDCQGWTPPEVQPGKDESVPEKTPPGTGTTGSPPSDSAEPIASSG